jgi:hypothetical protein
MFNLIDNFYEENHLGLMTLCFQNMLFKETHQSQHIPITNRFHGYPCYETNSLQKIDNVFGPNSHNRASIKNEQIILQ